MLHSLSRTASLFLLFLPSTRAQKESGASEKEGEEVVEEVVNPNCAKHCVCLVVSSRWPASIVEALRRHIGEYTGVDGNAENDASADDLSCQ